MGITFPAQVTTRPDIQYDDQGAIIRDTRLALYHLERDTSINCDLETSGLHFKRDKIGVVSIHGNDSGKTAVLHVRGRLPDDLKRFLSEPQREQIWQNGVGFDIPFLAENGVDLWDHKFYDTMVGEATVLTTGRRDLGLKLDDIAKRRLRTKVKGTVQDHGGWMNPELSDEQVTYAANDVRHLGEIKAAQLQKADTELTRALNTEMAVVNVVARMRFNGMPMDIGTLYEFLVKQNEYTRRMGPKLRDFFEEPSLNLGSHVQLLKALHKANIQSSDGNLIKNTRADTLEEIAKYKGTRDARICQAVLDYKHALKRLQFYSPSWCRQHVINGRVHPSFRQLGTDTGRFSCKDPNMQQVPQDMRQVFGGLPGWTVISADYSQIEVRVAAALANDQALIKLISSGLHVHTNLASQVFEVDYDKVTDVLLMLAKGITFLLLFGGGKNKFYWYASRGGSGLTREQCDMIFDKFFNMFQGIWQMRLKAQANGRSGGPVTLKMAHGLRRVLIPRVFPNSRDGRATVPSTQILNTLAQGNAASGIKYAMLECKRSGLDKYLSLQVHDELVSTVPDPEAQDYEEELVTCMIKGMGRIMDVPVEVKVKRGRHWQK
jgi:DNA polymerase I-like protein with 3'-5' exonuclease and polymerase domains